MERNKIEKLFGPEWVDFMSPFVSSDAFKDILSQLKERKAGGEVIYPDSKVIFRAFLETPLSTVRVIILGQDPYPGEGYANGLAFAHLQNMKRAPALDQIVNAIEKDVYNGLNFDAPNFDTSLLQWTRQGVLLLNSALTVKEDTPGSHATLWKPFMEYFVKTIVQVKYNIIWICLGKQAQTYAGDVNIWTNYKLFEEHPAKAAKDGRIWEPTCFSRTNTIITANKYGDKIIW